MHDALNYLPLLSAAAIYAARLKELGTKRNIVPGPIQERMTFGLFMAAGLVTLIGGVVEYLWLRRELIWWTLVVGWALALASFAIRRKAIAALGRFWSLHVEIRDNHQFVRTGPFRWMRHPTYFSMVLEQLAVGLILIAPLAFLVATVLFVPALMWRLTLEEKGLMEKFGKDYEQYRRETPMLFPYRWPQND